MRPRTVWRIVIGVLIVVFALLCLIYALDCNAQSEEWKGLRGIGFGLLALTAAVSYRYFED